MKTQTKLLILSAVVCALTSGALSDIDGHKGLAIAFAFIALGLGFIGLMVSEL